MPRQLDNTLVAHDKVDHTLGLYCDSYHVVAPADPELPVDGPYLCSLAPDHDGDHEAHDYVGDDFDHRNKMPLATWPQRVTDA